MAAPAPVAAPVQSPCSRDRWPPFSLVPIPTLRPSLPAASVTPLCLRRPPWAVQSPRATSRKGWCWGGRAAAFAAKASATEEEASGLSERWLLEPVGDGDTKHIGFRVPMPSAFEMASDVVTVGRLPDKADMVIPVATVSGLHARLEKKEGVLLVTDLVSTNGTYIDDKKLRPGVVATVSAGSCITFGDTHLAMFRVCKLQDENLSSETADSDIKTEIEAPQIETAS